MEWKNLLKTVAPAVGQALGGPLGGAAAAFVADKLGLENKTVEAVGEALASGQLEPTQIASLRLAEIDFRKFLEQNKIDLARLDVDNTRDARAMQVATRSYTPDILAVVIVTGFLSILTLAGLHVIKLDDNQAMLLLLGALAAGFGTVLNFFLGSSRSSQTKDALLANTTPAKK